VENLDIEQPADLLAYLRAGGWIAPDETPAMHTLGGGVSNRAVLVERRVPSGQGEGWVVKQALAKLRVAVDWFSSPERIAREAAGLRWLEQIAPPGTTTPLIFEDTDNYILAMQAVPQPHDNWKTLLLAGQLNPDHIAQFGRLLGTIHRNASGDPAVAAAFDDRSFYDSLRLEPYYRYTATQVPESAPFYDALLTDTWATRLTLVHGDYSPKNVLVHAGRLILLDHEVIHYGDPAFDLGFGFTHLLSKAHHLPHLRRDFATATIECWQAYSAIARNTSWFAALEPRAVRHTLGCLLARVAGRSPLEYLDAIERTRQRAAVTALMQSPPATIADLATQFTTTLSQE
jgi:tRNA A-37 threonylcarbamoyl transferase component Bud32